ncbi:MAG: transglutaminase [Calditrichaeota bacterium]|nr:transglutaminase [Calditrichota bacterium]RQW08433.1 MAG: transglutaminase [Calditrichota bacterium]
MKTQTFLTLFLIISWVFLLRAYPGKVVKGFQAPAAHITGMTFDGKNLWIADHQEDLLFCVNPENGNVIRSVSSPGFWPMGLAWDGSYLWNIDAKQKKIFKIDPADGKIMNVIDAPSDNPEGLVWDGKSLWVGDERENILMKIDMSDGTALKTWDGPARSIQDMAYDGRYIWCSDRKMDELYMIDPENGEVIIMTGSPGPYPRGLAWDGSYLWNVDYQTDSLYQLVRKDDEIFRLDNTRHTKIDLIHEVKTTGSGKLHNLDVYFANPSDLNQQKIHSAEFTPAGHKTVTDRWNQEFVHFKYQDLVSEAVVTSRMSVQAEISEIQYFIFPDECGTLQDIPSDIRKKYTANGSKYRTDDPFIRSRVEEIVKDEQNPYWIARKIFDYVRNTLEYKLEGGWNVAPFVLQRGTGSCSEYSFSFIALCRAAGVPARFVGAVVVRGDDASLDEVFHRWPEVYLPNYGWIPMDPQGGDKPMPRERLANIGMLSNRFLITTQGGGDSKYMGWYYNTYETYSVDPKVQVNIETFGEWDPVED